MTTIEVIKEYWGIIMFVLGLVYHALWSYWKIGIHANRLDTLEQAQKNTDKASIDLQKLVENIDIKLSLLLDGYERTSK